jgi:hypothetical protein
MLFSKLPSLALLFLNLKYVLIPVFLLLPHGGYFLQLCTVVTRHCAYFLWFLPHKSRDEVGFSKESATASAFSNEWYFRPKISWRAISIPFHSGFCNRPHSLRCDLSAPSPPSFHTRRWSEFLFMMFDLLECWFRAFVTVFLDFSSAIANDIWKVEHYLIPKVYLCWATACILKL